MKKPFLGILTTGALGVALATGGCSSSKSSTSSPDSGKSGAGGNAGTCTGGPETAPAPDSHCTEADGAAIVQATGVCQAEAPASGDAGTAAPDYGATMQGSEGDDDDCKYHVKFTVDPICVKEGVTFHLTVTSLSTKQPVTGANASIEAETVDNKDIATGTSTEKGNGVYDVGPVKFGSSGKWVVRFHLFETCSDAPEDSPHGHAAFFIDVP